MRVLMLLLLSWLMSFQAAAERRAFIVGAGDYQHLRDLSKTIEDASGYAEFFGQTLEYEVTQLTNPGRLEFNRQFGQFLESIKPGDEVVFVFSGHGWSDGAENYLIMTDAPKDASEYELKEETTRLTTSVLHRIKSRNPRATFAIIDACRDYPFDDKSKSAFEKGMVRTDIYEGMLVMYAAGTRQKALEQLDDKDSARYSVFTRVLLPKLRETGRPLQDIAVEVKADVLKVTRAVGKVQRPAYYDEMVGDFCLSGRCERQSQNDPDALFEFAKSVFEQRGTIDALLLFASENERHPRRSEALELINSIQAPWDAISAENWKNGHTLDLLLDILQQTSFEKLVKAADTGNANAAVIAARAYLEGVNGTTIDYERAWRYYDQACRADHAMGCFNKAWMINARALGARSDLDAGEAYEKSCRLGLSVACLTLSAGKFAVPAGMEDTIATAIKDVEQQCRNGNARACENLPAELQTPEFTSLLTEEMESLCERGFDLSCSEFAVSLLRSPSTASRGLDLLKQACEKSSPSGCYLAGYYLYAGDKIPKDMDAAYRQFERSCELGQTDGCAMYAQIEYAQGIDDYDFARGLAKAERSCSANNGFGCLTAGRFYEYGKVTGKKASKPDKDRALTLFKRGCELHEEEACEWLGHKYVSKEWTPLPSEMTLAKSAVQIRCDRGNQNACMQADLWDCGHVSEVLSWKGSCLSRANSAARINISNMDDAEKVEMTAQLKTDCDKKKKADACLALASSYSNGVGAKASQSKAQTYLKRACSLGSKQACDYERRR